MRYCSYIFLVCILCCGCQHKAPTQESSRVQPISAAPSVEISQTENVSNVTHACGVSEDSEYWEEIRKHSPNDNYLIGFDEDVDDVHDMEIYIEDY